MAEELVNVSVPRKHLSQVYGLIARLDAQNGNADGATESSPNGQSTASLSDEWTPSRLRKMVEQSPRAMIGILSLLASRPGEWLSMEELARAITHKPDANWNTVAGTLGAFGRRVKNRYGLESWPFENRYDHEVGGRVCRMEESVAEMILKYIEERGA